MVSGILDHPFPELPLFHLFHLFLCKIQRTVYNRIASLSRGVRQLGWATCLASAAAGWVTLTSGTALLYTNALDRLTGATLGVASNM